MKRVIFTLSLSILTCTIQADDFIYLTLTQNDNTEVGTVLRKTRRITFDGDAIVVDKGETLIVDVIKGTAKGVDDKYVSLIRANLTRYTQNVFHVLKEMGIRVKTTPITFTGGGALLMKKYAGLKDKNISYIDDIRANARGYDALARAFLKGRGITCL